MPDMQAGVHITNVLGLVVLLVLWVLLFKSTHLLVTLARHEPLIGWAIGPLWTSGAVCSVLEVGAAGASEESAFSITCSLPSLSASPVAGGLCFPSSTSSGGGAVAT